MPAEDEIEMMEAAERDNSNHPPSPNTPDPHHPQGYRQHRASINAGTSSPFPSSPFPARSSANGAFPLAKLDSIAFPPHMAIPHHGSGRFSVFGDGDAAQR